MKIILPALVIIVAVAIWYFYQLRNQLMAMRQQVAEEGKEIEGVIRECENSATGLLDVSKPSLVTGGEALEKVIAALSKCRESREAGKIKHQIESQALLSTSIDGLLTLAKEYPDLVSKEDFKVSQEAFENQQQQLSSCYTKYNKIASSFNESIKSFPLSFIVPRFKFLNYAPYELYHETGSNDKASSTSQNTEAEDHKSNAP
jgi:LemA protein